MSHTSAARAVRKPLLSCLSMAVILTLNGCASFQRPLAIPEKAALNAPEARTLDEAGTAASFDIDAGFGSEELFMLKPLADSVPLPAHKISGLSVTESGVYDALRLILKDTGITLNIEGGTRGSERFGPVSAFDVKGTLAEVLDTLSETIGFFYSYRKNTLFIQQEQQFVVELPPALSEDNAAGLTNTLQFLGARDPYIDRLNRSLVFRTNRPSLAKIEGYLQKIRDTRSLIIYDVNIFQVDLKDNSDTGIQWNKLGWAGTPGLAANPATSGATTGLAAGVPGTTAASASPIGNSIAGGLTSLGLGMVLSSSRFSIDMLINFLQTQGNVKAISRPRLAVISGTKGTLRVGQSTTYVSKVGTNFSTSLNQVTTETRDLKTGLDLGLFGDFSDNTVYTRIGLSISEIVSLNKFTALGTDLTLPTTADREINTVIRARPGDMILLGGITINRDSTDIRRGITQNGNSDSVSRSELVLALKAKVINFKGKNSVAKINLPAPTPASAAPVAVAVALSEVAPAVVGALTLLAPVLNLPVRSPLPVVPRVQVATPPPSPLPSPSQSTVTDRIESGRQFASLPEGLSLRLSMSMTMSSMLPATATSPTDVAAQTLVAAAAPAAPGPTLLAAAVPVATTRTLPHAAEVPAGWRK